MSWKGTTIPYSGLIEKVYINTNLSIEEVYNLVSNLEYVQFEEGIEIYALVSNADMSYGLSIRKLSSEEGTGYILSYTKNNNVINYWVLGVTTGGEIIGYYNPDNVADLSDVIEFNFENQVGVLADAYGMVNQNDKLSSLFSIESFKIFELQPFLKYLADCIRTKKETSETINAQDFGKEILSIEGGGIVEVTELPEVGKENTVYKLVSKIGTVIPNTKTIIENVYFNTALSTSEVVELLSQLTYYSGTDANTNVVFQSEKHCIICYEVDGAYAIKADDAYIFASNLTLASRLNAESVGWNTAFITEDWTPKTPVEVNEEIWANGEVDIPLGVENDKLTELFSITPIEGKKIPSYLYYLYENGEWKQISGGILEVSNLPETGENNYVYALKKQPSGVIYANIEGQGIINLKDMAQQQGGSIEIVEIVNSMEDLPSNPVELTDMVNMSVYYVRNNDLYLYGDLTGEGTTWFSFSTLMEIPFNSEVTSENDMTTVNAAYVLLTPSDGISYYLYENSVPTQVPSSGLIENLYFNTKLSIEETDAILSQLTYDYDGYAYVVGAYEKGSGYGNIIIVEANAFTQGQITSGYIIGHMHDTTDMTKTEFIYMSNQGLVDLASSMGLTANVGWNKEVLNLNQEFIESPYGVDNDKIVNIISTTPYPHWVSLGGGATVKLMPKAVPNSGYVEKVYLNKSLSFDEVNALVEKANGFVADELIPIYGVVSNNALDKQLSIMKLTDHDGSTFNSIHYPTIYNVIWSERDYYNEETSGSITQFKKGWMVEEDYVEINGEVVSIIEGDIDMNNVGKYNDQLTELFSINNVFKTEEVELSGNYDGSPITVTNKFVKLTTVPNSGYVEKVYFNTSLSIDEAKAILEKFFTHYDNDTLNNMIWLINIDDFNNSSVTPEKGWWIMPSRDTGDYAIVNNLSQVIFKSDSSKWTGGDFVGWNPEFITAEKPYLEINSEVCPIVTENGKEIKIGGFNDEIVNLFSLTPFEEKVYDNFDIDIKLLLEQNKLPLSVKVNVEPNLQEKEITENGEYVADEGYDGFSKVIVNVGGSSDMLQQLVNAKGTAVCLFENFEGSDLSFTEGLDLSAIENYSNMYSQCKNIITVPKAKYGKIVTASNMFDTCEKLTDTSGINELDLTNAETVNYMLQNCMSLEGNIELNLPKATKTSSLLAGCSSIKTVTITFGEKLSSSSYMLSGCSSLEKVTFNNIEISGYSNLNDFYRGCENLKEVPLTQPTVASSIGQTLSYTFYNCKSLKEIPAFKCINTKFNCVFDGCVALENIWITYIWNNLQVGSGTTWGHLLTLESLIHLVKECVNKGSARTLTMGSANLEKIASTYVKFTDSSVTTIASGEKGDVVVCESTDTGAMLLSDYALLKNWTLA